MISFNQLNKNTKKDVSGLQKVSVSLLGDSSTQLLAKAIQGFGYELGFGVNLYEADYNQIDLQLMNISSQFYQAKSDFVIVNETCQKLKSVFYKLSPDDRVKFAQQKSNHIQNLFGQVSETASPKAFIYFNFQEEDDAVFGNFANKNPYSFLYQIRKLNFLLMEVAAQQASFHILDYKMIHQRMGDKASFSAQSYVNNDMTLHLDVLPYVSKNCMDIIAAQLGVFKKCVILDLDNTMWGGVIGDDGIEGIQIGNLGIGKAFTNFQLWVRELKDRGIILAVCSKNYEDVAKRVFDEHPEMKIRMADISVFVVNWDNKADNIKHIQSILNIGFDSMVFLDDNKFEREIVKKNIPQITVPDLPEDPSEYVNYLKSLNLFETASFVKNDTQRTLQYQEESKRVKDQIRYTNQDDFLRDLSMQAEITEFNEFNLPRITQLIQRSNQFNLRTIRYSEDELKKLGTSKDHRCFSVSLGDKYGDYGLISVIITEVKGNELFIDTWVMSCRVLNRGVENFVINYLHNVAGKINGIDTITGEYLPTPKNKLVSELYPTLGFKEENGKWKLSVNQFETRKTFVQESKLAK